MKAGQEKVCYRPTARKLYVIKQLAPTHVMFLVLHRLCVLLVVATAGNQW
jgi:hypothetical protein